MANSNNKKKTKAPPKTKAAAVRQQQPQQQEQQSQQPKRKRASATERAEIRRKKNRKAQLQTRGVIAAGVLIVGGVIGFAIWNAIPESGEVSRNGFNLPVVQNDSNDDGRFTQDDIAGKPTVVNFYASWCTTCDAEMPEFQVVNELLGGQVNFVGIHSQESDGKANELPEEHGLNSWILAEDINGQNGGGSGFWESMPGTNPNGLPGTAFYDANGNYTDFAFRPFDRNSLLQTLQQLFGVAPSA
jgi:thiol-disulfide isomerase/thioredoxin